jgi:hypothetical protein
MLVLRALDAHLAGETYRTIAQGLFGERRVPSGASWRHMTSATAQSVWSVPGCT